jgi:S1-C subfamily serine protease
LQRHRKSPTAKDDKADRTPSNPLYDMFAGSRRDNAWRAGFIIDPKGYILTNSVIEGAT